MSSADSLPSHETDIKARIDSAQVARVGETVGLTFEAPKVTLFDTATGLALRSELNNEVLANG